MSYHDYAVFRDGSHSAIRVGVERKYTYYIPMEASVVRVTSMEHREFAEAYKPYTNYPVRRAAEIFLAAPDKEVSPKAREHLEAILADPSYAYDGSQFSQLQLLQPKEKPMPAKKSAAAVAESVANKPQAKGRGASKAEKAAAVDEAVKTEAAAGPRIGKAPKQQAEQAQPAAKKTAPAKKAKAEDAEASKPKGRAPALPEGTRLKVGNTESVKRGFMLEFVEAAKKLEKESRGKGFTAEKIIEELTTDERTASWVRTYVTYSLDEKRGILVLA